MDHEEKRGYGGKKRRTYIQEMDFMVLHIVHIVLAIRADMNIFVNTYIQMRFRYSVLFCKMFRLIKK